MKESYTMKELARYWDVHERTVRRLIERGELKGYRRCGSTRILNREVEKFQILGGTMNNRKPLREMDFSKVLNHFEPYCEAQKKLKDLIAQQLSKEKELNDLRRQRAASMVPLDEQARKILDGNLASGLKTTPILDERGSNLVRELDILKRAIALQKDCVDDCRRKSSHRYCEIIQDQWKEEIVQPIIDALKALTTALAQERNLRERMEEATISTSYFPGIALPLGDPRRDDSLIVLKVSEIGEDYDL